MRTHSSLLKHLFCAFLAVLLLFLPAAPATTQADNPNPPTSPLKLIFIHHSTGENWLEDDHGQLGITLRDNNYFVSDTNYGWGPDSIGDNTDIGHWWTWFVGPNRDRYTAALYAESHQNSWYSRLSTDPGGPNSIIMFKSCFPNSHLGGSPDDPPATGHNPLRGQDVGSEHMTVANAKGIYNDILAYFATRQDKLFIVITAPPLVANSTDAAGAANARAFSDWLVHDWLDGYPHANVAVFDFYNVLTSNGGNPHTNDLGWAAGNHHRWWNGAIQHTHPVSNDFVAYGSDAWDSHPTAAGDRKASAEFVQLLNVSYHRFAGTEPPMATPTSTSTTAPTRTPSPSPSASRTRIPGPSPTPGRFRCYLPIILKGLWRHVPPSPTATRPPAPTQTPTRTSTPISGCPGRIVIIQRGTGGQVADAYIWESEPDYTGNWETLYTGRVDWGRKKTLLRFDLSTLEASTTVHQATLHIKQKYGTGPRTVNAHRIVAQWGEDTVTWNHFGGRYEQSVVGSFSSAGSGWKEVDITALVQGWLNGSIVNYGVLLDDPSAGPDEAEEYIASEDGRTEQRPKLEICVAR